MAAKLTGYKIDVKPTTAKETTAKQNDVLTTSSANIILDDDFFSDIED